MRRTTARVTALLAAAAGGGLLVGRLLLRRQATIARRLIGQPLGELAPAADTLYKKRYGATLDLLVVGDSIAAGLGAELPKETLGARLATRLAKATRRSVRLRTVARVGSESSMLADQLAALPPAYRPDLAVIVVGGNDVTHRVPVAESVRHLEEAIAALRDRGAEVVVGTCPDLGALRPVPQPLRALAGAGLPAARPGAGRRPRSGPGRTRSRWRTWWARSSSPTPTRCSASTGSTPARPDTSAPPRRFCPRCSRRSAWSTVSRSVTGGPSPSGRSLCPPSLAIRPRGPARASILVEPPTSGGGDHGDHRTGCATRAAGDST